MLIGLDFDNTIAGYDHVFPDVAESEGLIVEGAANSKASVRSLLQSQEDGEVKWMALQGRVYGAHMHRARLIDGVTEFLNRCRSSNADICIISHKTKTGHFDPDKIDLRVSAMKWMENHGFFDISKFGLSPDCVFFESTRAEKVARIRALKCTYFVDDLVEVFLEPDFPSDVKQVLFAASGPEKPGQSFKVLQDWRAIGTSIFGDHD